MSPALALKLQEIEQELLLLQALLPEVAHLRRHIDALRLMDLSRPPPTPEEK